MERAFSYLKNMVLRGGPNPDEYQEINDLFKLIGTRVLNEHLSLDELNDGWRASGEAFYSPHTMQGFVVTKPHGYSGDFEIIDRIYTKWISPYNHLAKWDHFFHTTEATQAVRNRSVYLQKTVELFRERERSSSVESR